MSDIARSVPEGLDDGFLLESLPVGVYACDAAGLIVRYNRAAAVLWGREPQLGEPHERFCGSYRLFDLGDTHIPSAECPMAIALATGQGYRNERIQIERPDGSRIMALVNIEVLKNTQGQVTGAVNTFAEINAPRDAGIAAQKLAAIVESSDDAILSKDLDGTITSWNRGAERLFGYASQEVLGQPVTILIPDDRQDEEPEILARIRRGERVESYETKRRRKDGSLVDISLSVSPIVDAAGKIVGASKIARDITDRRRAEEQKDLLLREMDHRVKNLFALASAMLGMSGREAPSISALVADLQGRFRALSRAHSLTMPNGWDRGMEQVATLHALIYKVTEPYLSDQAERRFTVTGPDLPVGPSTVTNFALVLHEFATNALKYGALGIEHGQVSIDCSEEGESICITWREHDRPNDIGEPPEEGFGSRLVRATIEGPLGGSFSRTFTSDGVEIRLQLPRHLMSE